MVVGTARIVLSLPGNRSLKGKRKVIRRITDRVKHRYNASIAEVADMDVHQRVVLGLAVVSNEAGHAQSMLDRLIDFVSTAGDAVPVERKTELIRVGDGEHMSLVDPGWWEGPDDDE